MNGGCIIDGGFVCTHVIAVMSRSRVMCKVVVLLPLAMASVIAQSCSLIGNPGCACELDVSGGVIDLSSIGFQNGTPRSVATGVDMCTDNIWRVQ